MASNLQILYHPFKNIDEVCTAILIKAKSKQIDSNDTYKLINNYFARDISIDLLDKFFHRVVAMPDLFPNDFLMNLLNIEKKIVQLVKSSHLQPIFEPTVKICLNCITEFDMKNNICYEATVYYFSENSKSCLIVSYNCSACKNQYFPNYFQTNDSCKRFYENTLESKYIAFSNETVIETLILKRFTYDVVYMHASSKNFVGSYNALLDNYKKSSKDETKRTDLIGKRLTEYWFYWNLLIFMNEKFGTLKLFDGPFIKDIDIAILKHSKLFFNHFVKKWSGYEHKNSCKINNCSKALNIDGNHKCNRQVCMYDDIQFCSVEIQNTHNIGCIETPVRKSYYCHEHQDSQNKIGFTVENETIYYDANNIISSVKGKLSSEDIKIHDYFINNRDCYFYLVSGKDKKCFWCTYKQLPRQLVEEFIKSKDDTNLSNKTKECSAKEYSILFKNKTRSVGVLLGVMNCGVISGYREIFSSESLSQVSLFLLDLLEIFEDVPEFTVYDDACHLDSFLKNKKVHEKSERGKKLNNTTFVIDRLHIKNHVNDTCHTQFNSNNYQNLIDVNTVVCEQTNYWFSKFKHILKHMNYPRFNFLLYIVLNQYNIEKLSGNKSLGKNQKQNE